ncbi:MAG: hypothetical protein HXY41_12805 [Chloroflexi bacterium]|nr:hypothetical protein [Chloroflexota bacterium]
MSPYAFQRRPVFEERPHPAQGESTCIQPFFGQQPNGDGACWTIVLAGDYGRLTDVMTPEETAYTLARATAASILPPLTDLESGSELLEYRVPLRAYMSKILIAGLVEAFDRPEAAAHWQQVAANAYACVIGAGVAAYLDTTPGSETLSLRYANALASVLAHVHRAAELPRSRLFLQTTLYERFDALLQNARLIAWAWLAGGTINPRLQNT